MKRLTYLRLMRQASKAALARKATVAAPDLSKIESGRLVPYGTQLERLARALDWPVSQATALLDEISAPSIAICDQ